LIATDPPLVPLPAAVTTLLLTMAADVGVEANVNPPVGRDWLAAAWAPIPRLAIAMTMKALTTVRMVVSERMRPSFDRTVKRID